MFALITLHLNKTYIPQPNYFQIFFCLTFDKLFATIAKNSRFKSSALTCSCCFQIGTNSSLKSHFIFLYRNWSSSIRIQIRSGSLTNGAEVTLHSGDLLQIRTRLSGKGGPGQAPVPIPPLKQTNKNSNSTSKRVWPHCDGWFSFLLRKVTFTRLAFFSRDAPS